jgi:hypothetical protein
MATNRIPMDPTVQYPERWEPIEFTCDCGVKCRVDVEVPTGPRQIEFYQHCSKGPEIPLTGHLIAAWEDR